MEELQSLQKKLMEIQKSGGGFKLSERTVVDIIGKIMNRGKIKLIHTTNGREYVAEEKISKEISDELKKNQGIISKLELVKILEVPSNIIESKMNALISKDKSLNLIEGKLISNAYLTNICNEINEILRVNGNILVSDLATRFDFSMNFVKKFLKEKTGENGLIKAKLYETRLLTSDYLEVQRQKIRPLLIASTTPIPVSYLIDTYQIDDLIVDDIIKNLLESGLVIGKLSAGIYEPAIYAESQESYVRGVLMQNNSIEYTKLRNIGIIKNAKEYIKDIQLKKGDSLFQDGVYLSEYFISSQLKQNFEYVLFDNLSRNNSTNLNSIFYFELSEDDIFVLLDCINVKSSEVYVMNMNIIPCQFINNFVDSISQKLKGEASKQYNTFVDKVKEKEKKKNEAEVETKKKGKQKGKQKAKTKNEDDEELSSSNFITLTPVFQREIEQIFLKSSNIEELNEKEETSVKLFETYTMPKINQLYTQYINEFIKSKSTNISDPKNLMNQIENEYFDLKMIQKSIEIMLKVSNENNYQNSLKALITHNCKKEATNLIKNVLTYQLIHMKSKIDYQKLNDANQRKEIILTLPDEDLKEIFSSLNDSLQGKNLINFMNTLQENSKLLAISLSQLDKKKEKICIEKYSNELLNNIDSNFLILGRTNKKDYISLTVDICHSLLLKKGLMLKLPYEPWTIGIFLNIFDKNQLAESKTILSELSEILNLSDTDFLNRIEEANEYLKKFNYF